MKGSIVCLALILPTAFGAAFSGACRRDRTPIYPPPPAAASPQAPLPAASSNPSTDATLPAPSSPPAPVLFREGPVIRFRSRPALSAKLVANEAEALALSPDARSYVLLSHGRTAKLITPSNPSGFEVEGAASTQAMFSPDGSLAVVFGSGLTVLDVATGKKRVERDDVASCAIRFTADGGLVWQEEAGNWNEWSGPLLRLGLTGGSPVAVGPKRFARQCEAAPDGSAFIVTFPEPVALVDGRSGKSRVLVADKKADVHVSPAADRYCVVHQRGDLHDLTCTRVADGGIEQLFIGASYASIDFDSSGRRALCGRTRENPRSGDIVREVFLADFTSATLSRIDGFEPKSGSIPALLPGGRLLAQGSSRGMMVYDLDRGEKRFIAKKRLFGAEPMRGHERRFFADAETFGGQDNAELYFVEWP